MFNKTPFILAASALSAALLVGCNSTPEKETSASTSQNTAAPISTAPVTTSGTSGAEVNALDTSKHSVYFDFDKSDIKPEGQPVVSNWASYLASHPTTKVRLEGNCDERGTREYNVGLGERRGNAVAQALEAAGVSASQVSVVSYGKERPVCTQHNEACWSQNRRVDLVKQ